MYLLKGRSTPSKPFVTLGEFTSKQALRDRLAELQQEGAPRRHWYYRQMTVVGKERSCVAVVNFPLPKDLRLKTETEKTLDQQYPNMAKLAPQIEAMARKEGW